MDDSLAAAGMIGEYDRFGPARPTFVNHSMRDIRIEVALTDRAEGIGNGLPFPRGRVKVIRGYARARGGVVSPDEYERRSVQVTTLFEVGLVFLFYFLCPCSSCAYAVVPCSATPLFARLFDLHPSLC